MTLVLGALVAVVGPVSGAGAATVRVEIEDYGYAPAEVRITVGDRVRWVNQGSDGHTVTSDAPFEENFDSGRLDQAEEYSHTFEKAGTYRYHCDVHDSMKGTVEVDEAPTTTTSSSTTTTTQPTTTTTAPPTTTTAPPPPPPPPTTVTTRAPATTTTTGRVPAAAAPPSTSTTAAPSTTTTATSPAATGESTSSTSSSTSTTVAVPAPPPEGPAAPMGPEVPEASPPEPGGEGDLVGERASAPASSDGGGNPAGAALLIAVLLGAGAFGGWTLWKLRPVRT